MRDRVTADYDAKSLDDLAQLIINCDVQLLTITEDSTRVDAFRTVIWYVNAAMTRKGFAPSSRKCLGAIPRRSARLLHDIRKQDAAYYDLQWLGFKHPKLIPPKWSGIIRLVATAPGGKTASEPSASHHEGEFAFGGLDRDELLTDAFSDADRLIGRQMSVAKKCQALKLSPAIQSEMRWLRSASTGKLLAGLDELDTTLRKKMKKQQIKQLTDKLINRRMDIIRAWKLAGGGTKWQATADTFKVMTGHDITRQAIRDMITRLSDQKLVRLRRGRKKIHDPLLTEG